MDLDSGNRRQESVDVKSGVGLKHLLALELLEVANGQFQNVGFLQLGDGFTLRLKCGNHQVLEIVQTLVNSCSSTALEQRLHHFAVLVGARHGGLVDHVVVVELDG